MREFLIFGLRKLRLWLREEANFSLILSFVLGSLYSSGKEGRREGKRKLGFEGFKKIKVWNLYIWNSCMEFMYEILVWNSYMEYLYGNYHKYLIV